MYFKLTNQDMTTYAGFEWALGKWYRIQDAMRSKQAKLCCSAWFHCYDDELLAVLFNPIHAGFKNPRLFRANVRGLRQAEGVKFGFSMMRVCEEIEVPKLTLNQRVAFGILAAEKVYMESKWQEWSKGWLSNIDRTYSAARTATRAADAAVAVADAAFFAARAAAVAADAASAAADAARAAAVTAHAADAEGSQLNLRALARECLNY